MKKIACLLMGIFFTLGSFAQAGMHLKSTITGGALYDSNSFIPKSDILTGIYPHSLLLFDFNGDNKQDLVVCKGSSNTVSVFTNSGGNGNISFSNQTDLTATGTDHQGSAAGDLDGDGKPDLVITNGLGDSSVSVYRNTGTGTTIAFSVRLDMKVTDVPYSVAIGDLDGDGKPDLAVANTGNNSISLFRNTSTSGNISFDIKTDLIVGTNPYSITIGDLDNDGGNDLVITNQGPVSGISVLKNLSIPGSFIFSSPVSFSTQTGLFIITMGDLDGDGKQDIAAASSFTNSILVLKNSSSPGNIAFSAPQYFSTGTYPVCVAIKDLDGDGLQDLVSVNRLTYNISALKNASTGGLINFESHVDYPVGMDPFYVAVGDLDGDGRPDIAAANSGTNTVSILQNMLGINDPPVINGFSPLSGISGTLVKITGTNFTGANSVEFGGVNATSFVVDSATGITATVGEGASGNITIRTGNGVGTKPGFIFDGPAISSFLPANGIAGDTIEITGSNFSGVTAVQFGSTPAASFVVNSPTSITAVLGTGSSGNISVITSLGTASLPGFGFGAAPLITSFSPSISPLGSTVVINGVNFQPVPSDNIVFFGAVQATVSAASSTQLSVIVPAGASYDPITVTTNHLIAYSGIPFILNFPDDSSSISQNSFEQVGNFGTGNYPVAVSISDLNLDGKPDLITANSLGNSISILQNNCTPATIAFSTRMDLSTGPDPKQIAVGDLNGDGKPDIVVSDFNAGGASSMSIFQNTSQSGILSFTPNSDLPTGNGTLGIAIADINGDGKPDVIVTSGNSGLISIFKNISPSTGPILFAPQVDYFSFYHPDNIKVTDMDNDGKPDIISSNSAGNTISIYRNLSYGGIISLDQPINYPTGTFPEFLNTADLDGDGKPDLIVGNYSSGTISFYNNLSTPGSITIGGRMDSVVAASTISVADLNGDGLVDICVGRGLNGKISVFQNTNTGSPNFSFSQAFDYTIGNYDVFGATGDLDGDGKPDLAGVNVLTNTVTILKNKIGSPVITAISDTNVFSGSAITISGKKFINTTKVIFGGVPADSYQVVSSTQINAVVGGGASGDIEVVTPKGSGTIPGFRFIPKIASDSLTTVCAHDYALLRSTAAANNQWYKDGVIMNGETGASLHADKAGIYTVSTTSNGITTVSDSGLQVFIISIPAPVITKNIDNSLFSNIPVGNQWYFNGNIIAGATNQTFLPTQNGLYTVNNNSEGCTSDFANAINIVLSSIIDLGNGQFVKMYPNPVRSKLNLQWNSSNISTLSLSLTDLKGNQIFVAGELQSEATTIDLSNLAQGYYFLKIYNSQSKINTTVKIYKID